MKMTVYEVRDHGALLKELLKEQGFTVRIGDGHIDEALLSDCEVLLPGGKVTVDKSVLDKAGELKLIVKSGVGYDRIDVEECTRRGIYVANTPTTNFISVAEHALMLMLAVTKQVYPISIYLRHAYPDFWCRDRYEAAELYGKRLTVIGLGNIGRRVAELCHAFGMEIIGYDPYADPKTLPEYIRYTEDYYKALSEGDIITLHVAGGASTRHMVDADAISRMKKNAIIINVARGSVIDEEALIEALREGRIAGAGLDVFETEPLKDHDPLMLMENVVATPHCAGNTAEARLRTQQDCAANIIDFYEGRAPRFALNNVENRR